MSTTLIDKLFAVGATVTGKAYRMMAAENVGTGVVHPLKTDDYCNLNVAIGPTSGMRDIFSRLRVSQPTSVFDGAQIYDKAPLVYVEDLTSGGTVTYLPNESSSDLTVTGTSGSKVIRQSRAYIPYQPGRSQYAVITGNFNAAVANVRKRWGYFDADNGVFLEQNGTTDVALTCRTNTSGTPSDAARITQDNWNIDPLDGSGISGVTLDLSKFNVMFFDFGWLGGAGLRVGFFIGGIPRFVHSFDVTANTAVFMSTPSLPVRYEIESTAASAGATLKQTCAVVFSEGGFDPAGAIISQPLFSGVSVNTTPEPIISVRLKSGFNRGLLIPIAANAMVTSVDDMIGQVIIRGTLTGGSWSDTSSGRTEYNTGATAISGGIVIASFFVNDNGADADLKLTNALAIAADFAGTTDILSLVMRTDTGSANVLGSLTWRELF